MSTETRHTLITALGGVVAVVGMFVFHLVSEPVGWVLCGVGMAVFTAPFVTLTCSVHRTPRVTKRRLP